MSSVEVRNNVKISGINDAPTLMLAHGFGCDQNTWRFKLPQLQKCYRVVMFDYVGSGNSSVDQYSVEKYSTLEGYANDIKDIIDEFDLTNVTIIAHSVSSMIAAIAVIDIPDKIKSIVMVCPSPCFLDIPPDYFGGFERSDLEELIDLMDKNYIGWANYLAPLVMGGANSQALISELSGSFCSTDPLVAKTFAQATFFSDHRSLLPKIPCKVLILQSSSDALASLSVGEYMSQNIAHCDLVVVNAEGHCLHMTHHQTISPRILAFIE